MRRRPARATFVHANAKRRLSTVPLRRDQRLSSLVVVSDRDLPGAGDEKAATSRRSGRVLEYLEPLRDGDDARIRPRARLPPNGRATPIASSSGRSAASRSCSRRRGPPPIFGASPPGRSSTSLLFPRFHARALSPRRAAHLRYTESRFLRSFFPRSGGSTPVCSFSIFCRSIRSTAGSLCVVCSG